MLCQNCNQNEASMHYHLNMNGMQQEFHLCSECAAKAEQHYANFLKQGFMMPFAEASAPKASPDRVIGKNIFGGEAAEEFKNRRKLGELRQRLSTAVANEQYELAAQLRDQIKTLEQGVCTDGK